MKYTIKIIFGKEQIDKYIFKIPLSKEEIEINVKEYSFETEIELIAFKKGVLEAVGWMECQIIDQNVSKPTFIIS
jgi:hypothetical protein